LGNRLQPHLPLTHLIPTWLYSFITREQTMWSGIMLVTYQSTTYLLHTIITTDLKNINASDDSYDAWCSMCHAAYGITWHKHI
jgi:hypothetical protein